MSSSGLIYAVIVGAWAAYLVPMWLRRQDELNEARPTERFSTAIRLLSGRAAMERRNAKDPKDATNLTERSSGAADDSVDLADLAEPEGGVASDPGAVTDSVDVRAFAVSSPSLPALPAEGADDAADAPGPGSRPDTGAGVPACGGPPGAGRADGSRRVGGPAAGPRRPRR